MNWNAIIDSLDLSKTDETEVISKSNRRDFFKGGKNISLKSALLSLPVAALLMPRIAKAQGGSSVTDTLNFALTLEYLEDEFYRTALATTLIPASDRTIFSQISKHETAHVAFLKAALGTAAVAKPIFDFTAGGMFPTVFTSYTTFLTLAQSFEDTGVRAYKGQAGNLMGNDTVLTQALQIHSVQARHAAEVRWLRGQVTSQTIKPWIELKESNGAPQAIYDGEENTVHNKIDVSTIESISSLSLNVKTRTFDEPLTKAQVLTIVTPFIAA